MDTNPSSAHGDSTQSTFARGIAPQEINKPLAIDLFCGLGGWTDGLLAEGWNCVGFDIERHDYGDGKRYPAQLVIQDVRTIHGSQFKDAALIVASPPCQEYSYMAMPWSRAKAIAADYRAGKRDTKHRTRLFDECFRIQREASEAAGRKIPMVVENVRGAQPWVGRARWNYGSFYLWGDVPALMPIAKGRCGGKGTKPVPNRGRTAGTAITMGLENYNGQHKVPGFRFDGSGRSFQTASVEGQKTAGHINKRDGHDHTRHLTNQRESDGVKQGGISGERDNGKGDRWFQDGAARSGSKSNARKAASAAIAKIPLALSQHIARVYRPVAVQL